MTTKKLFRAVFGPAKPTAPIVKHRVRPSLEALGDRIVPAALAAPQTFIVTTELDNNVAHVGLVSLRDAVNSANSNGNPGVTDTIQFAAGLSGKTIKIGNLGELQVSQSVSINGLGAINLKIDGSGSSGSGSGGSRIFDVFGGSAAINFTVKDLTISNGNTSGYGGAIFDNNAFSGGTTTLINDVFSNNTSGGEGGVMYSRAATLTIQNTTFSNNTAGTEGGAIVYSPLGSSGSLNITRSTFANNTATNHGGGALWINDRSGIVATISRSSFYGNVCGQEGGAIGTGDDFTATNLTIDNTTISGNTARNGDGGGIFVGGGTVTLRNDTITKNTALNGEGGGVYGRSATININNSIVEGDRDNTGANDISTGDGGGSVTFNVQYSLIQFAQLGAINGINSNNIFGVSANLQPLGFYGGGTTKSQPPLPGSRALRSGSVSLATGLPVDQNGNPRTAGGFIDMGAVQSSGSSRRGA